MAVPLLALVAALGACTRTSIPLPIEQMTPVIVVRTPTEPEATEPIAPGPPTYAVVWVGNEDSLKVRETAGITGTVLAELSPTQVGLERTGKQTRLGSSIWVEVRTASGQVGWVPSWNLTEYVPEDDFCRDGRVSTLLVELERALAAQDSRALPALVSPKRGLIVRLDPWNPEVRYGLDDTASLFSDRRPREWGTRFAGETVIRGTFDEVVGGSLRQTVTDGPGLRCNELSLGRQAQGLAWPMEYSNLNFYSFMLGPEVTGNPNNWRTWVVGIEYVGGRPYLTLLMQFRPQA